MLTLVKNSIRTTAFYGMGGRHPTPSRRRAAGRVAHSMRMPVVSVREMWVRVNQRFVLVTMAMFGTRSHRIVMRVQVVFVMDMFVTVFHFFVLMSVFMALG